jgi:uncharacterized protein (DUF736 family)
MKLGTSSNRTLVGTIATLTLQAQVKVVPVESKSAEHATDYRVKSGALEIGAGRKRASQRRGELHQHRAG